jgi:hypothetical protein
MKQCKIKTLARSRSGKVFRCLSCRRIHVEFNNFYFTFTDEQFSKFRDYFLELDVAYLEGESIQSPCNRKIMIPFESCGFHALFHPEEIRELQFLLSGKQNIKDCCSTCISTEKLPEFSLN